MPLPRQFWLYPAIVDASQPTKRGWLRRPTSLEVPVAHLWHTRVRNAGQQGQPSSGNHAQKGESRAFPRGFGRSHSPSVVDSSPVRLCQQYSSKVQQRGQPSAIRKAPTAPLTCSTPFGGKLPRGSGRRGRRFKSCHPDQCHRSLMRECRTLGAVSQFPAVATEASREQKGTRGNSRESRGRLRRAEEHPASQHDVADPAAQ